MEGYGILLIINYLLMMFTFGKAGIFSGELNSDHCSEIKDQALHNCLNTIYYSALSSMS